MTDDDVFDPEEGEALKDKGMEAAHDAADPTWEEEWREAIKDIASLGIEFTSDEVRQVAGPPRDHPNAAGSLFTTAAREGLIEAVGYRKSTRTTLHRHPLTVWRGVNHD